VRQAPSTGASPKNTGFRLDLLATIPEVPGAISQGRTREEARTNVIDALRVVLTPDEQLAGERIDADAEPLELTIA
jgi:predicted RNase H-like HicB family nuclease